MTERMKLTVCYVLLRLVSALLIAILVLSVVLIRNDAFIHFT